MRTTFGALCTVLLCVLCRASAQAQTAPPTNTQPMDVVDLSASNFPTRFYRTLSQ